LNKIKHLAAVLIAIAGFGLQHANAVTMFTSSLNQGNSAISGFAGPYGNVNIVLTSSTAAIVVFTNNTVAGNTYLFGATGAVALDVNATTFSVSNIMGTNSGTGFIPGPFTVGSGQESSFGMFNLVIDSFDGTGHASSIIMFTLTNTSGTWGSPAAVLAFNSNGFDAAAHIFVMSAPANASNSALATGFAGEGTGTPTVPDGGTTVMLLGAALGALGMARRFLMS
jgi:VPDSG-CTERM motif